MSLLCLLLSCAGPPTDALSWREQWEILILTEDGGIIEGIANTGNTGMYRGEGQFRANRWFTSGTPILFGMDGGPADVDVSSAHDAVRVGSALVGRFDDGEHWTMRFSNDEANAIVRIDPGGPQPPLSTGMSAEGQWTLASPISNGRSHGWFTAGRRGGMFEGKSVALHRGGDGRPPGPRQTVVIMGPRVSIGLDSHGSQRLAWARIGDLDLPTSGLTFSVSESGNGTLDFGPETALSIDLVPTGCSGTSEVHQDLSVLERLMADFSGLATSRTVRRAKTRFKLGEEEFSASAVIVDVE